jgi:transposase
VGAEESVVPLSEVKELLARIRELERLLGRKTMEVEILKDAVRIAREKKTLVAASLAQEGQM